jgi:hypothetical protein
MDTETPIKNNKSSELTSEYIDKYIYVYGNNIIICAPIIQLKLCQSALDKNQNEQMMKILNTVPNICENIHKLHTSKNYDEGKSYDKKKDDIIKFIFANMK